MSGGGDKKIYIGHGDMIECSHALRPSAACVPLSHGVIIKGRPQLVVSDSKAIDNILSFGVCNSPKNPDVIKNAKKMVEEVNKEASESGGIIDKIIGFFCKDKEEEKVELNEDFLKKCVGKCKPKITIDWIDGKENVLVDDKQVLLDSCKLNCMYNGKIKFMPKEE